MIVLPTDYRLYLEELGVYQVLHSKATLGGHLYGVYCYLCEWGVPISWADAGLFHSVYGTEFFKHQTTRNRSRLMDVIGEKAERFVYLFCSLKSPRIHNILTQGYSEETVQALLCITAANSLEQGGSSRVQMYRRYLPNDLNEKIINDELNLLNEKVNFYQNLKNEI